MEYHMLNFLIDAQLNIIDVISISTRWTFEILEMDRI